jgi:uncharacterized protein
MSTSTASDGLQRHVLVAGGAAGVRERLRADLLAAMKAKDRGAVAAIRSALSAIANAEAVPAPAPTTGDGPIAGAVSGVAATDAPRRDLSDDQVRRILRAEITEREHEANAYDEAGRSDTADRLRREAAVLETLTDP